VMRKIVVAVAVAEAISPQHPVDRAVHPAGVCPMQVAVAGGRLAVAVLAQDNPGQHTPGPVRALKRSTKREDCNR
jgi:hypothetical protein